MAQLRTDLIEAIRRQLDLMYRDIIAEGVPDRLPRSSQRLTAIRPRTHRLRSQGALHGLAFLRCGNRAGSPVTWSTAVRPALGVLVQRAASLAARGDPVGQGASLLADLPLAFLTLDGGKGLLPGEAVKEGLDFPSQASEAHFAVASRDIARRPVLRLQHPEVVELRDNPLP
jgi:hypothetical protein